MARTDFASMFSQLPTHERQWFETNPVMWADYCLTAAGMPGTGKERLVQQGITDQARLIRNPVHIPLTRQDWLTGLALGPIAVDRFTQAGSGNIQMRAIQGWHRLTSPGA